MYIKYLKLDITNLILITVLVLRFFDYPIIKVIFLNTISDTGRCYNEK